MKTPAVPGPDGSRPRLLVVDDQPANLQVLYRTFAADHQVFMATGGLQALQQCRRHRPDLVLLDIGMPDVDGHEVCRRLKDDPATRDIPVIFVTGHDDDGQEALGLDLGAVDFIAKPVNPGVVRARVRTHLALARSTALLAATLEATAEGILVTDAAGRIGSLNQRFVQLWQLPLALVDAPDAAVFAHLRAQAADPARHDRDLAAALAARDDQPDDRPDAVRLDQVALKGDRHLERRTTTLRVNGAAAGHVLSFRDVTAERRAARELHQLNDNLEARIAERTRTLEEALRQADAASRAKSAFLSNMSHEIRTPMSGVIGLAHLALRAEPSPVVRGYLEKMRGSGEHLLGIVNDILDFSRIEAGGLAIESAAFSLPALLESVGAQVEPALSSQGLAFSVSVDPALQGELRGDGPRLRQVLLNLVQNAVKFTSHGAVAVRALAGVQDATGVQVRIEVEDSGIGIAPELVAELFQPFQQADASSTRPYGGTGIGLAICKRLADLMGGMLSVQSEVGAGSTFALTLRLERPPAGLPAAGLPVSGEHVATPRPAVTAPGSAFEPSPEANPALAGRRVLVVEDNAINREVATGLLEAAGVVVDVAHDGQQALDRLATHRYDAVLMDLQMPVLDGLSATRAIRDDRRLDGMPVLAMTANAAVVDRARCTAAGMSDFIVKPVMPAVLYTALARAFAGQAPATASTPSTAATASAGEPARSPLPLGPAPDGDPELIDVSALLPLTRGDPAKLRRYLEVFRQSLGDARGELDAALEADDRSTLGLVGLRLKSSAAAVGAAGLATLFRTLERQSGHASRHELRELVQRLVRRSLAIDGEIERIFAVLPETGAAPLPAPGDDVVSTA